MDSIAPSPHHPITTFSGSERLQYRADDRARELVAQAIERVGLVSEKGGGVGGVGAARGFVLLTEDEARVLPQHRVAARIAKLDPRRHRDRVARGELCRR